MNLKNRTILITGSNRGIGKALVTEFLKRDVKKVYTAARDINSLPDFADPRVVPLELDIVNNEQIEQAAKAASDIDLLLNNAGVLSFVSALTGPMADINRDMAVNYFGLLKMMRAFIPVLEAKTGAAVSHSPAIVNVASIASFVNFPFHGGYCASKAAAFSITQCARIELQKKGIQVHSVNPGPIDTDMTKDVAMEKASPEATANIICNELEAGNEDIFPDPTGAEMFALWKEDYKKLEHMASDMFNGA